MEEGKEDSMRILLEVLLILVLLELVRRWKELYRNFYLRE